MDQIALFTLIMTILIVVPVSISKKKQGKNKIKGMGNTQVSGEHNATMVTNIHTQNNYDCAELNSCESQKIYVTPDDIKAKLGSVSICVSVLIPQIL